MKFVHKRERQEGISVLSFKGVQGDRESLRDSVNRQGYALREDCQFDVDVFAEGVYGGPAGEAPAAFCPPCGVCRQVMREFCGADFTIVLSDGGKIQAYTLEELLPCSFGPENL